MPPPNEIKRDAAAKYEADCSNANQKATKFSKLVTYAIPTPKSQTKPRKHIPSPKDGVSDQKSPTPRRPQRLNSNATWETCIRTVSVNRRKINALLQVSANTGFGPGPAFPKPTQRLPHHTYYSANSLICKETGAALEYCHLKIGANSKLWLGSASKETERLD